MGSRVGARDPLEVYQSCGSCFALSIFAAIRNHPKPSLILFVDCREFK